MTAFSGMYGCFVHNVSDAVLPKILTSNKYIKISNYSVELFLAETELIGVFCVDRSELKNTNGHNAVELRIKYNRKSKNKSVVSCGNFVNNSNWEYDDRSFFAQAYQYG